VRRSIAAASPLLFIVAISACSTGGSEINPTVTQVNPQSNSKLQFVVGTANIAADGVVGLNVVATLRQPNGNSAVLADLPTIAGPPGFTVPNTSSITSPITGNAMTGNGDGGSGTDAGTNHISASPQQPPNPTLTPLATTLGPYGGLFSYGFGPYNSDQTGSSYYPGAPAGPPTPVFEQPFYSATELPYVGGPPAYPYFNDGTYPTSFIGYLQGFAAFEAAPVVGAYALTVAVAAQNAPSATLTAHASLSNPAALPPLTAPTFTSDSKGGGTGTVLVPSDPRILETMVYVVDLNATTGAALNFYAVGPLKGTGTLAYTLPDLLGPCSGTKGAGCQNDPSKQTASIPPGDGYAVYAVSYDYPAFEASPPINTSQTPTITGASSQADVSLSPTMGGVYMSKGRRSGALHVRMPMRPLVHKT